MSEKYKVRDPNLARKFFLISRAKVSFVRLLKNLACLMKLKEELSSIE